MPKRKIQSTTAPVQMGNHPDLRLRPTGSDHYTLEPAQLGDFTNLPPEFGRVADVTRHFGIKRGTAYNLLADGKIKGCLLRVRGKTSGVRLIDMASVRTYIRSQATS
jgi:hypothetical protein